MKDISKILCLFGATVNVSSCLGSGLTPGDHGQVHQKNPEGASEVLPLTSSSVDAQKLMNDLRKLPEKPNLPTLKKENLPKEIGQKIDSLKELCDKWDEIKMEDNFKVAIALIKKENSDAEVDSDAEPSSDAERILQEAEDVYNVLQVEIALLLDEYSENDIRQFNESHADKAQVFDRAKQVLREIEKALESGENE
jgi:hypothetical protein